MTCALIRPEHVDLAWPSLWPMLEPAVRLAPELPDVHGRLLAGDAQLWAIVEGGRPVAAVVTEITLEPEKRCRLWLVGGNGVQDWAADLLGKIEDWARPLGCAALWGTQSRAGWRRLVKRFGGTDAGLVNGQPTWERRIA